MAKIVKTASEASEIDQNIIKEMENYGIETSRAKTSLDCNLKNSITTLYFLLSKKNKNIIPHPPTSLSSRKIQKIQKINGIQNIDTKREQRPISRIKVTAKSISPKCPTESRSTTRAPTRIRRFIVPTEPESKPKTPIRNGHRNYKPIPMKPKLNLSYKNTPRNFDASYRINSPSGLLS